MSDNGQQVPLIERLRRVPAAARVLEHTPNPLGCDTTSIPVGALCQEAADRIDELESKLAAEREALRASVRRLVNLLYEAKAHLENRPMSMCVMSPGRLRDTITSELTALDAARAKETT